MKNLKKPNWSQKQRIAKAGIDPMKVSVKADNEGSITVVERESGKTFLIVGKNFKEIID